MSDLARNQRVRWEYDHVIGFNWIRRVKKGVYLSMCRHTSKHWRHFDSKQLAWVHFDGNKGRSRVPYSELIFDTGGDEEKE